MPTRTSNQELFDLNVQHAIAIERLKRGFARELVPLLNGADENIRALLISTLDTMGRGFRSTTTKRLENMLKTIGEARADVLKNYRLETIGRLEAFGIDELDWQQNSVRAVLPFDPQLTRPKARALKERIRGVPFAVGTDRSEILNAWFTNLSRNDRVFLNQTILHGIAQGHALSTIVRAVMGRKGTLSASRAAATRLVRTAINHTTNQAREVFWAENNDGISGLRWTSVLDSRTSLICSSRDGNIYPIGSGPRPPAHPNCVIGSSRIKTPGAIAGSTARKYRGKVFRIRVRNGDECVVTPNHPVYTRRGWVAAQFLDLSDQVGTIQWVPEIHHNNQQMPSRIDDLHAAFGVSGSGTSGEMPGTTKDFHGDGINGEVTVVHPNSFLGNRLQTTAAQVLADFQFILSSMCRIGLISQRTLSEFLSRAFATTNNIVGFGNQPFAFSGGSTIHPSLLLFGTVSDVDTFSEQNPFDDRATDIEVLPDSTKPNARFVQFDDLVDIETFDFCDHVYNLDTEVGWYSCNNIITHNCRSIMTPVVDGEAMLGNRPFVIGENMTTTRFRQLARSKAGDARWRNMDSAARKRATDRARAAWAAENVGELPAETTYEQFLRRQSAEFQDSVLGPTKGALFRRGKVSLSEFVDETGRTLTLEELREENRALWKRLKLNNPPQVA